MPVNYYGLRCRLPGLRCRCREAFGALEADWGRVRLIDDDSFDDSLNIFADFS